MKLRIFLILYTIFAVFCVFDVFFDTKGFNSLGAAILICVLAAAAIFILLIAMWWDSENRRRYFWALLWVCLPPLSIWIKDLRLFQNNDGIETIQLKELE
jgi:hypothetical protein